jgi:hypothetical protein
MSERLVLEAAPDDREIIRLQREIAGLEQELTEAREERDQAVRASADAIKAIRALRAALKPAYDSFRMIFGEISRVEAESTVEQAAPTGNSIWADRLAKSNGAQRRIIQTLLDGGGAMELRQIRAAAGTGGGTSNLLNQLQAKNWVQKIGGGQWALK